MQEVYGVELGGLVTGQLSWRRLIVLISQLPAGSRLARARDVRASWSVTDYLLAQVADTTVLVADEIAALRWMYATAHRGKSSPVPRRPAPHPRLPRPGQPHKPAKPPATARGSRRAAFTALAAAQGPR